MEATEEVSKLHAGQESFAPLPRHRSRSMSVYNREQIQDIDRVERIAKTTPSISSIRRIYPVRALPIIDDAQADAARRKLSKLAIDNHRLDLSNIESTVETDEISPATASTGSSRSSETRLRSPMERLIEQICMTKSLHEGVWGCLSLAGEIEIPSKTLFDGIADYLQQHDSEGAKLKTLLAFCNFWLEGNRETSLVSTVQEPMKRIISWAEMHTDEQISKRAAALKIHFTKRVVPKLNLAILKLNENDESRNAEDFFWILEHLEDIKTMGKYHECVEGISQDLLREQVLLYHLMTPHHFIEKKCGKRERDNVVRYDTFQNSLCAVIVDTILSQKEKKQRVLLIKFFLDIAKVCLSNHDYATVSNFATLFYNPYLQQLQSTWKEVLKVKKYREIREEIETLFSFENNHANLRRQYVKLHQEKGCFVPHIGIFRSFLIHALEHKSEGPYYNVEKLEVITREVLFFTSVQGRWIQAEIGFSSVPYSNIVRNCILTHKELNDDARDKLIRSLDKLEKIS